jgi:hypothetical protein
MRLRVISTCFLGKELRMKKAFGNWLPDTNAENFCARSERTWRNWPGNRGDYEVQMLRVLLHSDFGFLKEIKDIFVTLEGQCVLKI